MIWANETCATRNRAMASCADMCAAAPATLTPMGENSDLGMAHMVNAAASPPPREKANMGEKMLPVRAEAMTTLPMTTTMAHGPPKAYRAHRVRILARPNLKNGAGRGMNDSIQCRATAMATKRARVAMRVFLSTVLLKSLPNLSPASYHEPDGFATLGGKNDQLPVRGIESGCFSIQDAKAALSGPGVESAPVFSLAAVHDHGRVLHMGKRFDLFEGILIIAHLVHQVKVLARL